MCRAPWPSQVAARVSRGLAAGRLGGQVTGRVLAPGGGFRPKWPAGQAVDKKSGRLGGNENFGLAETP